MSEKPIVQIDDNTNEILSKIKLFTVADKDKDFNCDGLTLVVEYVIAAYDINECKKYVEENLPKNENDVRFIEQMDETDVNEYCATEISVGNGLFYC